MAKLGQYNLDEMTAQEAFEASAIHLLEQSKASKDNEHSLCAYKTDEGICCAAAIFIQGYNKSMEGRSWSGLVDVHNQTTTHKVLVHDLQFVHDDDEGVRSWITNLYTLGARNRLDTAFLNDWSFNESTNKYEKSN